jgi:hypothetical protein
LARERPGGDRCTSAIFIFPQPDDREGAFYLATVPTVNIKGGEMQGQNNPTYDPATGATAGIGRTPFPDQ